LIAAELAAGPPMYIRLPIQCHEGVPDDCCDDKGLVLLVLLQLDAAAAAAAVAAAVVAVAVAVAADGVLSEPDCKLLDSVFTTEFVLSVGAMGVTPQT